MAKLMLTVKELQSEVFSNEVSAATIYTMARQGEIPVTKIRGKLLFHRPTIEAWLANGGTREQEEFQHA